MKTDNIPMTKIGKMFNVSDNAVKKRCKIFGINWRKRKLSNRSMVERGTQQLQESCSVMTRDLIPITGKALIV